MIDKRHTHRIHFDCLVEFKAGEFVHVCELFDLSLRGALIGNCSRATPAEGTDCELTLTLAADSDIKIAMQGVIAHKVENRVGIHCTAIDIDSMTHLRKLVEYNLGDSGLLERDLKTLLLPID